MADVQRIGVGNAKYPGIDEPDIIPNKVEFEFSSEEITFDQVDRTFDEN